jgi:hypothetical protein
MLADPFTPCRAPNENRRNPLPDTEDLPPGDDRPAIAMNPLMCANKTL